MTTSPYSIESLEVRAKSLANQALESEKKKDFASAAELYARSAQTLWTLARMTFDPKAMQFYLERANQYDNRSKSIGNKISNPHK
jgi:hypothetical protein